MTSERTRSQPSPGASEPESPAVADRVAEGGSPGAGGPPVSRRAFTIGMCTTVLAVAFEVIAVATAMPVAARDLDGLGFYAWSFSAFMIGMLFATVVAGRLSDRVGPAPPVLAGLVLFAVGLVVAGTAQHMAQLVAGRLVQGLGSGMINTALFVAIAQLFTRTQRPRVFTFISTAWIVPSFLGPPISAGLTAAFGWRAVFLAVLPLTLLGGAMILPTLLQMLRARAAAPRTPSGSDEVSATRRPAALWAAAVLAGSAAALQLAGQRWDWAAAALLVLGLAGLIVAVPRLMPPGYHRLGRGLPAVVTVRGLLPGAFFGAEAFIPLMLVEQRGLSLFWAGAMLTAGSVGWFSGSWLQSRTWLPVRRDRLITFGCLAVAVGIAVIAVTAAQSTWWFGLVGLGWALAGLGMGLSTASTNLTVMTLSDQVEQGRNAASLNVSDALGSALFIGLTGTIFVRLQPSGDLALTFGTLLTAMVVVAALAAATSLRVGVVRNEFTADSS